MGGMDGEGRNQVKDGFESIWVLALLQRYLVALKATTGDWEMFQNGSNSRRPTQERKQVGSLVQIVQFKLFGALNAGGFTGLFWAPALTWFRLPFDIPWLRQFQSDDPTATEQPNLRQVLGHAISTDLA